MSSPASTCLNLPGTVAILTTVANSSWIPPINSWLSNFCAADDCTSDQISATVGTVADGCSAELEFAQVTKDDLVNEAVQNFGVVKEALCLREYVSPTSYPLQTNQILSLTAAREMEINYAPLRH